MTEFFEVISKSAPHIYHSALLLAPESSLVRELYHKQIPSPSARIVTGIPASWDACTATIGATSEVRHAVWSPCGQFVAVCFVDGVGVQDSTTLERVSSLLPPTSLGSVTPKSMTFSPDGRLLACTYDPVREPNMFVSPSSVSLPVLIPYPDQVYLHPHIPLFGTFRQVLSSNVLPPGTLVRLPSQETKK